MDVYSGYNQIMKHEDDKANTSFIIERGTYYYKVMPFRLKNVGATYQSHLKRHRSTSQSNQGHPQYEVPCHDERDTKSDGQSNNSQPIPLRSTDKCKLFFKALKKGQRDKWDEECKVAFQNLKTYLTSPFLLSKPILGEDFFIYLAMSNSAISSTLIRQE
ncbi:hypothetical protein L3X38_025005 [Prunus dulcis]|uniref:Transposable element protein n=1 Tax=Prunus dulcis TaxID=3755 RepID=A0AAD4W2T6_PRUDU|nr:hypothetical protein L3X38_025005 [Prunus dulcis]